MKNGEDFFFSKGVFLSVSLVADITLYIVKGELCSILAIPHFKFKIFPSVITCSQIYFKSRISTDK